MFPTDELHTRREDEQEPVEFEPPYDSRWRDIQSHMQRQQVSELATRIFRGHYRHLLKGQDGYIREAEIEPVESLPHLESLSADLEKDGEEVLAQTVMLKLNGGLGTSMGLDGPKSLLPVRDDKTFLDFIVDQARFHQIPLLLMNSFATMRQTAEALKVRGVAEGDCCVTFLQHRVPKIHVDDHTAAVWDANPDLAWCPPGHGDLYASLLATGTLKRLLEKDYRFMFVSNADNLGATLDLRLLGHLARQKISFLMEVADRTEADRKGGHLARRADGTLILRESAQCHPEETAAFQDVSQHRFFNTNNLWIDLQALDEALTRHEGALPLPLIVNRKTLDPCDAASPKVFQLETAMGAAISLLPGAEAVCVPRARFAPVKTTSDLLAVCSDAYRVDEQSAIRLAPERLGDPPTLELDERFYKLLADLAQRIPQRPSLIRCRRLAVVGDFEIPAGTVFVGEVELVNRSEQPVRLAGGEITGKQMFGD